MTFRPGPGLPFAVSPRSIEHLARRVFDSCPDASEPSLQFRLMRYAEHVATLKQLRSRYRIAARQHGNLAAYAATPEGRRVHRTIDTLTNQIAAERNSLCG